MNRMSVLMIVAVLLAGCERRYESALKTEAAVVTQLSYVPATHGRTSGGVGFTSSGKLAFCPSESVSTDEVYAVVFRCHDHGATFALTGKSIYEQAHVGDAVTLEYVDIITEDGDGHQKIVDYQTKRVIFQHDPASAP